MLALVLVHPAQVDRGEPIDSQRAQVLLDICPQLGRGLRRHPPAVTGTSCTDLRHDREIVRVRVQRLADQLVRHIGAVELRGVDVIDAQLDRAAQDAQRLVTIARRPEHTRSRKLHRTVTDAPYEPVRQPIRVGHRQDVTPRATAAILPGADRPSVGTPTVARSAVSPVPLADRPAALRREV